MEELKTCPFCGKQPEVIKRPDRMDGFFCAISCFCGGNTSRADQFATDKTSVDAAYEKAAKLWNRRAEPENKALTVEQLRKMASNLLASCVVHETGKADCTAIIDFDSIGEFGAKDNIVAITGAFAMPLIEKDYGKTWLAYVRKPEGSELNGSTD